MEYFIYNYNLKNYFDNLIKKGNKKHYISCFRYNNKGECNHKIFHLFRKDFDVLIQSGILKRKNYNINLLVNYE